MFGSSDKNQMSWTAIAPNRGQSLPKQHFTDCDFIEAIAKSMHTNHLICRIQYRQILFCIWLIEGPVELNNPAKEKNLTFFLALMNCQNHSTSKWRQTRLCPSFLFIIPQFLVYFYHSFMLVVYMYGDLSITGKSQHFIVSNLLTVFNWIPMWFESEWHLLAIIEHKSRVHSHAHK